MIRALTAKIYGGRAAGAQRGKLTSSLAYKGGFPKREHGNWVRSLGGFKQRPSVHLPRCGHSPRRVDHICW